MVTTGNTSTPRPSYFTGQTAQRTPTDQQPNTTNNSLTSIPNNSGSSIPPQIGSTPATGFMNDVNRTQVLGKRVKISPDAVNSNANSSSRSPETAGLNTSNVQMLPNSARIDDTKDGLIRFVNSQHGAAAYQQPIHHQPHPTYAYTTYEQAKAFEPPNTDNQYQNRDRYVAVRVPYLPTSLGLPTLDDSSQPRLPNARAAAGSRPPSPAGHTSNNAQNNQHGHFNVRRNLSTGNDLTDQDRMLMKSNQIDEFWG